MKKIPLDEDFPKKLICTVCLLPTQYQSKSNGTFVWQCFKCGKKFFVTNIDGHYKIEESWSSAK